MQSRIQPPLMLVHDDLPSEPIVEDVCGDVGAARSAANALLGSGLGNDPLMALARLALTSVILHKQSRLDRPLRRSDLVEGLRNLATPKSRLLTDSPMLMVQYASYELAELSLAHRLAVLAIAERSIYSVKR